MADNRVYKLPRDVLAKMTGNNPQAIKALENIETKALEPAPEIDTTVIIETSVAQSILSAPVSIPSESTTVDTDSIIETSIVQSMLNTPVGVPFEPTVYLAPVAWNNYYEI